MDKNQKYRKDKCQCGMVKDKRAQLCSVCRSELNVNNGKDKPCRGCGNVFPIEEYNLRVTTNGKMTRRTRCKKCCAEYSRNRARDYPEKIRESNRAYATKHPEKIRMYAIRSRWKKMGFNPDEIEKLITEHKTGCEICGDESKLVLDHDHSTGAIRGFLCSECNLGLGKFRDSQDLLRKAVRYLEHDRNKRNNE